MALSAIGKPLFADECTTKQTRIFYARMLIEVNVTKAMPTEIMVMDPRGRVFQQDLVYEWKPVYCDKCQEKTQHCLPVETRQSNHNQSEGGIENNGAAAIDKGKKQVLDFSLENFPMLTPLSSKNGSKIGTIVPSGSFTLPHDRGGGINSINEVVTMECMIETRVKEQKAKGVSHHIAPGWEILYNYNVAVNGRIWVIWDTSYYSVNRKKEAVMGKPDRDRSNDIHSMGDWGDFNDVLQLQDRMHGNPVTMAETQDFSRCIQDLRLSELTWEGEYYTWSNKQDGCDRIWSRIGKIFGNYEWMMQWRHISTVYKMPFISDDAPMSLTFNDNQRSRKTPFNFFNVWADHERFLTDVQQIWQ
ncbi:uncharacterized protein LOC107774419 [Nicotiana tabacum]|uniref:Uncharacterized protein LOC107774419 n=1 Tax=Nicotiana tabacum TaxID=4097 RepID=A0AC58UBB6_TOBAC